VTGLRRQITLVITHTHTYQSKEADRGTGRRKGSLG